MKRFWQEVTITAVEGGYQVALDGRGLRTQGGAAQVVPHGALAQMLADEWRAVGEIVNPNAFPARDLADYAIDQVAPRRTAEIASLLRYAESDTLLYRAEPDDALYRRQRELWEPLVTAAEARHGVSFTRTSGIIHRPQPTATLDALRSVLEGKDAFTLAALATLAPLAASLIVALAALEPAADPAALFAAANAEEDWQAELWGEDAEAAATRALKLAAFSMALRFAEAARG